MPTDKLSYGQRMIRWLWLKVRPLVVKPVPDWKEVLWTDEQLAEFRRFMASGPTTKEVVTALAKLERSVEHLEKECRERAAEQAKVAKEINELEDTLVDEMLPRMPLSRGTIITNLEYVEPRYNWSEETE